MRLHECIDPSAASLPNNINPAFAKHMLQRVKPTCTCHKSMSNKSKQTPSSKANMLDINNWTNWTGFEHGQHDICINQSVLRSISRLCAFAGSNTDRTWPDTTVGRPCPNWYVNVSESGKGGWSVSSSHTKNGTLDQTHTQTYTHPHLRFGSHGTNLFTTFAGYLSLLRDAPGILRPPAIFNSERQHILPLSRLLGEDKGSTFAHRPRRARRRRFVRQDL